MKTEREIKTRKKVTNGKTELRQRENKFYTSVIAIKKLSSIY